MSSFVESYQFPISTAHHTPHTLFHGKKIISSGADWILKATKKIIFSYFTISNFPHLCLGKIIRSIIKIGGGRGETWWYSGVQSHPSWNIQKKRRMMRLLANRKKSQIYEIIDLWSLSLIHLHDNVAWKSKKMSNMKEEKNWRCGFLKNSDAWNERSHKSWKIYKIVDLGYTCMDCSDAEMKLLVAPRKYLHAPTVKSMPQ